MYVVAYFLHSSPFLGILLFLLEVIEQFLLFYYFCLSHSPCHVAWFPWSRCGCSLTQFWKTKLKLKLNDFLRYK